MLRVVTWRWHDPEYRWNPIYRYTPRHVNRLARAVRENLRLPHEFVCITDDPDGLDPEVRAVPLWSDARDKGGCYVRLKAFSPEMQEVIGERFVSLDLDCVVTGDLTPLFDRADDFVIWKNQAVSPTHYCGSMFMMTAGARARVWDTFDPSALVYSKLLKRKTGGWFHPALGKNAIGSDQAWISSVLGPHEAVWRKEDGVWSFRFDCRRSNEGVPDDCRIVFFHGPFSPCMPEIRRQHPWIDRYWREVCH